MLYVTCPAEQKSLDKTAIRKKEVEIHFADWSNERLMCPSCGWAEQKNGNRQSHQQKE